MFKFLNSNKSNTTSNLKNLNCITKINLLNKTSLKNFFRRAILDKNYYEQLGVSIDADYEIIKKKYYDLAKKYHPDINKSPDAIKAYEVLGDPNLRAAYDIDNHFTQGEDEKRKESDIRFANKYGRRIMRGPRSIKNFYYNKWTDYKTPKWSNLHSGEDVKSEYIFRESDDMMDSSHREVKFRKKLKMRRFIIYFLLMISLDVYLLLDNASTLYSYFHFKKTFFMY